MKSGENVWRHGGVAAAAYYAKNTQWRNNGGINDVNTSGVHKMA